jgi:hypothetical protein
MISSSKLSDPSIPSDAFENTVVVDTVSWLPPGTQILGLQYGPNYFLWDDNPLSNTTYAWNNYTVGISGNDVDTNLFLFE